MKILIINSHASLKSNHALRELVQYTHKKNENSKI